MDADLEQQLSSVIEQERSMGASDEAAQLEGVLNEEPSVVPPETGSETNPADPDLSAQGSTEPALMEPETSGSTGGAQPEADQGEDRGAAQAADQTATEHTAGDQGPDDRVSAIIAEERSAGHTAEADELQQALGQQA